jgi:alkylation response protein AidB-like acyl-CoA dehydrogenase
MARTADSGHAGITAFLVPAGAPGLSFGANEKKMGWNAQPTAQVVLRNVRVPESARLGAEGQGFGIAMKGLNGGRLNIAACSLGGGQAALEKTVAYLKERRAFGERLADMEALRFAVADMAMELDAARALLRVAADALDRGAPEALRLCATAKRVCTDAGYRVADQAIQLHGGYGYLHEYGVEKIARDLRVHQILEGSNEIMRLIVGRQLLEG